MLDALCRDHGSHIMLRLAGTQPNHTIYPQCLDLKGLQRPVYMLVDIVTLCTSRGKPQTHSLGFNYMHTPPLLSPDFTPEKALCRL